MNDLERKLRQILEGITDDEDQGAEATGLNTFAPSNTMALNDDAALARALGAQTLNGTEL